MIAADARPLTYREAAVRAGCTAKTEYGQTSFISKRVAAGEIEVLDLGHRTKRISEMALQQYLNNCRAVEKTTARKAKVKTGAR